MTKASLLALSLLVCSAAAQDGTPAAPPMELLLPQGQKMVFIPVEISDNPNIFAYRSFNAGSGDYTNEPVTRVNLAGTAFNGKKWYIPFCETEVTRAQYAAVMGEPMPPEKEANLPKVNISVTDAQNFLTRLNKLMAGSEEFAGALIPYRNEKTHSFFFRLPSPVEWEFAARGGVNVDEGTFDAATPYPSNAISRYEVTFTGSRHVAARPVKGSRKPNPVGLYDMLGNVSELASPIYYFDSSLGRSGGILTCGGNFRTEKATLHSSDRSECVPYREDGSEFRSELVGFRPVLGSVIRHREMSMQAFSDQWKEYEELRTPPPPVEAVGATTEVCLEDLAQQAEAENARLRSRVEELEAAALTADTEMKDKLAAIRKQSTVVEAQLKQSLALVRKSEQLKADAALTMLSTSAAHLSYYLKAEADLTSLLEREDTDDAARALIQPKLEQFRSNIAGARLHLFKGCKLLADVPADIADAELNRHLSELAAKEPRQQAALRLAADFFSQYRAAAQFPDPAQLLLNLRNLSPAQ